MSWDAPTAGARPPSLPVTPSLSETPSLPRLPAHKTSTPPQPTVDVLGDVAPFHPGVPESTPAPNWKKRKKSKLRRLVTGLITLAVLGALGAGAVFGYRAMNPPEEPKSTVPLRDRPETIFGRTGDLVDGINEGMPDQELLDQVLGEDAVKDTLNDGLEPNRD